MSNFGFVYILTNNLMRCFKIGCTERSPHTRAEELSKASGVPTPFEVACYIEVRNFQEVERRFHSWMAEFRVDESREFFFDEGLERALRLMYWLPDKLAFAQVDDHLNRAHDFDEHHCNPWKPKEVEGLTEEQIAADVGRPPAGRCNDAADEAQA